MSPSGSGTLKAAIIISPGLLGTNDEEEGINTQEDSLDAPHIILQSIRAMSQQQKSLFVEEKQGPLAVRSNDVPAPSKGEEAPIGLGLDPTHSLERKYAGHTASGEALVSFTRIIVYASSRHLAFLQTLGATDLIDRAQTPITSVPSFVKTLTTDHLTAVYIPVRYSINNTAPRPESYLTDYTTANGPDVSPALNESQRSALYAEPASGAESGCDYTARWFADAKPGDADLKQLNVRIPVDLNSILYKNHLLLAQLYASSNDSAASGHREAAAAIRTGILDLMWNSTKMAFYDFNLASAQQSSVFSAAAYYPYWSGIIPDQVLGSSENAFKAFAPLNLVLNRYNGTFPSTFLETGLRWDYPNAWPPHQYILLQGLRALPSNITSAALIAPSSNESTFNLLPQGQLGITETQLPGQTLHLGNNATDLDRARISTR
ncbi:hypothetical protein BDZ89DRAFT_1164922 [Hymenopellis radicata]|nr:hypothetical protein BDZ89DRAFT_1164922 [Hymenopellis radicata]